MAASAGMKSPPPPPRLLDRQLPEVRAHSRAERHLALRTGFGRPGARTALSDPHASFDLPHLTAPKHRSLSVASFRGLVDADGYRSMPSQRSAQSFAMGDTLPALLGPSSTFTGQVEFSSGLAVAGSCTASVVSLGRGTMHVHKGACVKGDIIGASKVFVEGKVEGNVTADYVYLAGGAEVTGDIHSGVMEDKRLQTNVGKLSLLKNKLARSKVRRRRLQRVSLPEPRDMVQVKRGLRLLHSKLDSRAGEEGSPKVKARRKRRSQAQAVPASPIVASSSSSSSSSSSRGRGQARRGSEGSQMRVQAGLKLLKQRMAPRRSHP